MRLALYAAPDREPILVEAQPGQSFAQAIWLSHSISPKPLCSGLALCGRCRVRFLNTDRPEPVPDEERFFSAVELAQGWRLACRHIVPESDALCEIMLPDSALNSQSMHIPGREKATDCFLGIDLGTTSIQWRCVSSSGATLAQSSLLNPQAAAGPDVISRLNFSAQDSDRDILAHLVLDEIFNIVEQLARQNLVVKRLCIAANSVMTHILLKCDLHGLSAAPYRLAYQGGEIVSLHISRVSLPCVIPPLSSPFIGGDISAGLLTLMDDKLERPFVLADLGTNAELALLLPDGSLYLASAPLGPAMEGIGPKCGQPAGSGVATAFSLGSCGLVPRYLDGKAGPYISATGYLSLISLLINLGLMDRKGHFILKGSSMPLLRRIQDSYYKLHGQDCLSINDSLFICSSDVELLLKVKASLRVALARLLKAARVKLEDIKNFILAGAISENAELPDLLNLGLIPEAFGDRLILGGNTSLEGACLLALNPSQLESLDQLCSAAHIIDLANDHDFLNSYLAEMTWQ